ncbi:MAG: transporter substrate-binding domain-containing protein, partial [Crenarchaeota archaeon]|nr:transporter substrate-binding domain-containing protein [Thermoproteota archaeon]
MFQVRRLALIILAILLIGSFFAASMFIPKLKESTIDKISVADLTALNYYTEQCPPCNYQENGTLQGVAVDLLGEITENMGRKVSLDQLHLVPWTEAYQTTLNSSNSVLFSTVRLDEREQLFSWAGPIYSDSFSLFARWDENFSINSTDDLEGYRIGVITDDSAILQLLSVGVDENQLVYDTNAEALIEKLSNGEIDLWCYSQTSGQYIIQQATGNYFSFKIAFTLESVDFYFAFSKDIADSTVEAFQHAIDEIKQVKENEDSLYDQILGRYIPHIGLAQLCYLTEEWAPFNYLNTEAEGISVEILEAIFQSIGVNRSRADVEVISLSEGLQRVEANTKTVLFSIARTAEREDLYKWAGPFTKSSFVCYASMSKNITISSAEDLNNYRIGVIESTVENNLLINQGVNASNIFNALTPKELIDMLEEDQIDVWTTGDITGRYEMQKAGVDPNNYEIIYEIGEDELYFVFSKDVSDVLVDAFEQALEVVRHQKDTQGVSQYERIIYQTLGVGYARQTFTNQQVIALVNKTAKDIENNATQTFRLINS